jgi:predicted RNase H-like nuclease (RuvC/YqgF family)
LKRLREENARLRSELERERSEKEGLQEELEGLRKLTGKCPSPRELSEMKAEGWRFSTFKVKGREYVRARRGRESHHIGPLEEAREALRIAGITLEEPDAVG